MALSAPPNVARGPLGLTAATAPPGRRRLPRAPLRWWLGLAMAGLVVALALAAPWLAPHAFDDGDLGRSLLPPAWMAGADPAYPLGTDYQGRDLLSRLLFGARTSLSVGVSAAALAALLGVPLGLAAGFFSGWTDDLVMRLADAQLAFPPIVLAVGVLAVTGPSLPAVVALLGLIGWVQFARVVRAQTLSLRERDFVAAARVLGAGPGRILLRHVLPNTLGPVLVIATVNVSSMLLTEASLSFLGLGVRPPTPAWGSMLSEARDVFYVAWWNGLFPGLAIVWTVFGVNLLGDVGQPPRT